MTGRILESAFRPHPLLRSPHRQTLAPYLFRPPPRLDLRIERLELDDGDFVDLGWAGEHHIGGPIAVLVHGLGGGFESKYKRGLTTRLVQAGWRCVMLQLRGGGIEPNRLARSYHHGDTSDVRALWRRLRAAEPTAVIAAVGWSLGGNIVLRALAEEGAQSPVDLAAAASVPFRLLESAHFMSRGFSRFYQWHMLATLRQLVQRKRALYPDDGPVKLDAALAASDFFAFDNAYTAPLHGFSSAEDYYRRTACGAVLGDIRRPTLIVQALDDPFIPSSVVPKPSELSPDITLELAASGGHVGFVGAGLFGQLDWWLERRLAGYLQESVGARESSGAAALTA
jgi:predicted alpha/beta-fold hydrolase